MLKPASKGVEELVAVTAGETDAGIKIAPPELSGEAVCEIGLDAPESHTVFAVDAPIVVLVHEFHVARLKPFSAHGGQFVQVVACLHDAVEAQAIERAERLSLAQDGLARRAHDDVAGRAHARDSIAVVGNVGGHGPEQVALAQELSVDGKFHALVHHVAHIAELCAHALVEAYWHVEQEVAGLLVVGVGRDGEAVVEETDVCADVIRRGGLPAQVLVVDVGLGVARLAVVLRGLVVERILVVAYLLVAHLAPRGSNLKVGEISHVA